MSAAQDFGLENALNVIDYCLYGIHDLPDNGRIEYAHRQMIAMQYPQLVSALLDVMNRTASRNGGAKK